MVRPCLKTEQARHAVRVGCSEGHTGVSSLPMVISQQVRAEGD